jgi:hypothetical protein
MLLFGMVFGINKGKEQSMARVFGSAEDEARLRIQSRGCM